VGDGDGKLPSLADTIAAVRRELSVAQADGQGQPFQFRTGPVELEFEVAVTPDRRGQAGRTTRHFMWEHAPDSARRGPRAFNDREENSHSRFSPGLGRRHARCKGRWLTP